jgi:hypothetical protein
MLSVAPASVMLLGLFGLFVVAFATTRMALIERKIHRPVLPANARRYVRSNA